MNKYAKLMYRAARLMEERSLLGPDEKWLIAELCMGAREIEQQAPVAWMYEHQGTCHAIFHDPTAVEKYHNLTPSTPLYSHPPESQLLRQAIEICREQGRRWDSDEAITDRNYAGHCANLIEEMLK